MTNRTTTRALTLVAALAAFAGTAGAQGIPPRPAAAPAKMFTFPRVQTHELPNGLRLFVVEDHSVPVVAVRAVLDVDETFDPPGKEGLYQVTLGALREGTTSHTPDQLAAVSAKAGTPVSPTSFTTTPSSLATSLELMGEMLMQPSFPQAGIDRRKAATAATFRSVSVRPQTPSRRIFYSLLDGADDPIARNLYATEAGVGTITRDDVVRFHDENIGPGTTTLVVVGDVTDANAVALVKQVFGGWKKAASKPSLAASVPPALAPTTIHLFDVPGATTTFIAIGNIGPARNAPDAFALEAASTTAANRFVETLREKRALVYSAALAPVWRPVPRHSEFWGTTAVAPLKTDTAIVEWMKLLRDIRGPAPVTAAELAIAKATRVGQLWMRTDGPDSTANRIVEATRDHLRPDFLGVYAAGVNAVTLEQAQAAAKKYIDVDHLVVVVTGDRKVLEPMLRAAGIGPVVIVDASGKPLASSVP